MPCRFRSQSLEGDDRYIPAALPALRAVDRGCSDGVIVPGRTGFIPLHAPVRRGAEVAALKVRYLVVLALSAGSIGMSAQYRNFTGRAK